jgi:hypothetical protein
MRGFVRAMPFLAVPLAAAACGGGKSASTTTAALPDDPLAAVKGAARKTVQAGSEHAKLAGRVLASGQTITFTGGGDFDTKAHTGSMSLDLSVSGINATVDEVSHGSKVYVKSDLITAMLPAGKTWVKIDVAKAASSQGVSISSILAQDPASALARLKSLRGVTKIGEAQVDGVSTTHYRGRMDLSALTGTTMAGTGRYDVWIGDDGYVHRVKAVVTSSGTTSTVTSDISAFGEPVDVTVPSAAETYVGDTSTIIPGLGG